MNNGAEFSQDRKYRYCLWRIWDENAPKIMFIGLNPSTANESKDDPTIRRVTQFAKDWGYGGVFMMNLFGFVTAYPKELKMCADPIGDNNKWLGVIADQCPKIIFAWGNFKEAIDRANEVKAMFPNAYALQINKNGSPKHPLYVKADVQPVIFSQSNSHK